MSTSTRSYFRRLAEGYEDGALSKAVLPLLELASQAYGLGVGTTRALYQSKVFQSRQLPFPVVSIGNLTWGGTGKTPFVEYLSRRIIERHRTPLVLTRGYNNDEVEQFKHHIPRAVIGVGRDRYSVAKEISAKQKIDIALLDDGFQHWPVSRNLDILMVNTLNPFGNRKLIPRGILREPLPELKRASIVVLTHVNLAEKKELHALKDLVRKQAPRALIVESYLEPLFFYRAKKRARVPLEKLQNQRVTTFSGVGAPRSFQLLLSQMHIRPIRNFEFTDHHAFTTEELKEIQEVSTSASATEIITTEKDYYRSPKLIADLVDPLVLATRLRIQSGEEALLRKVFELFGGAAG